MFLRIIQPQGRKPEEKWRQDSHQVFTVKTWPSACHCPVKGLLPRKARKEKLSTWMLGRSSRSVHPSRCRFVSLAGNHQCSSLLLPAPCAKGYLEKVVCNHLAWLGGFFFFLLVSLHNLCAPHQWLFFFLNSHSWVCVTQCWYDLCRVIAIKICE